MSYAAVGLSLAGQIPVITMAGVTKMYAQSMLGKEKSQPQQRRKKMAKSPRMKEWYHGLQSPI